VRVHTQSLRDKTAADYNAIAREWNRTRQNFWGEFEFARSLLQTQKILDAGCGNGRLIRWLRENNFKGEYLGVDFAKELLAIACQNFSCEKFKSADLRTFALPDKFDAVFCIAVLHHFSTATERLRVLQNLHASLAPGGRIFLTVWNLWQPRFWKFFFKSFSKELQIPFAKKVNRHVHAFTLRELRKLFHNAGFQAIEVFGAKKSERAKIFSARNLIVLAQK